jgi:phage baseplate assembly protein W
MNILGSTINFPFRADKRGTLAVSSIDDEIITQAIFDLLETRQGERVMLPTYGLPDVLFDVLDASFAARLSFFIEEQIRNYVTAVESVSAESGTLSKGRFDTNALPPIHTAAIRVRWTARGRAVPQELIYPTWRLIEQ